MNEIVKFNYLVRFFTFLKHIDYKVTGSVALFSYGVIDTTTNILDIVTVDNTKVRIALEKHGLYMYESPTKDNYGTYRYYLPEDGIRTRCYIYVTEVPEKVYKDLKSKKQIMPTEKYNKVDTLLPKEIIKLYISSLRETGGRYVEETLHFLQFTL